VEDNNKVLKVIYTLFLGLIIAVFVGIGINTLYDAPRMPNYPDIDYSQQVDFSEEDQKQQLELQDTYAKEFRAYDEEVKFYSRNVSIIALALSVILIVLSTIYEKKLTILADGMMLGGLFTLLYSIIRSVMYGNDNYMFIAVSTGMLAVVYLGYKRFARPAVSSRNSKK
jgi:hypothetical protein